MGTFFIVLAVLIAIGALINAASNGGAPSAPTGSLEGDGDYEHEVVGESNYQPALRNILDRLQGKRTCEAMLVLEDDNPHDDKAVAVMIDGDRVGHLSREDARKFRKHLAKNKRPVGNHTCKAKLAGGTEARPNIGVWLDVYS